MALWGRAPTQIMNTYMDEYQRRQMLQEKQRQENLIMQQQAMDQQREQEGIRNMYRTMGLPEPQGYIPPNMANTGINIGSDKIRWETSTKQKAQEFESKKSAFLKDHPEASAYNLTPANIDYVIDAAETRETRQYNEDKYKKERADKLADKGKEPSYLQSNTMSDIDSILGNEFVQYVPETELTEDRDFTKPETVYFYLSPEDKSRWNSRKSELVQKATTGGTMGLYGNAPQSTGVTPPPGATIDPRIKPINGKPVYVLPNGKKWIPE